MGSGSEQVARAQSAHAFQGCSFCWMKRLAFVAELDQQGMIEMSSIEVRDILVSIVPLEQFHQREAAWSCLV
jgi:hypothetical protein